MIRIVCVVGIIGVIRMPSAIGTSRPDPIGRAAKRSPGNQRASFNNRFEEVWNVEGELNRPQDHVEHSVLYLDILWSLRIQWGSTSGDIVNLECNTLCPIDGYAVLVGEHALVIDVSRNL